jgi:hypothetical protein
VALLIDTDLLVDLERGDAVATHFARVEGLRVVVPLDLPLRNGKRCAGALRTRQWFNTVAMRRNRTTVSALWSRQPPAAPCGGSLVAREGGLSWGCGSMS